MQLIHKYFPDLTSEQYQQLEQIGPLYTEWNSKINLISRKDIEHLYPHHILHSMSIAKMIEFKPGAKVMDLGTGGGFPGLPLAILFPETEFLLVDSIRKKVRVAQEIAQAIGLKNLRTMHSRVEEVKEDFDFVVTRAVAVLPTLMQWCQRSFSSKHQHALPNGLIALKGIDRAKDEVKALKAEDYTEFYPLQDFYEEPFFETKCIVYTQA